MKILFVTGNKGKIATLRHYLDQYGIELEQRELPLVEPQYDSIEDIVKDKARQAFAQVKSPVVVQDSGFFIQALQGFPGPYAKYVIGTLGPSGLLKLMVGEDDRTAKFVNSAAYCDATGNVTVFTDDISGQIALQPTEIKGEAWSALWSIFTPKGKSKTLGEMDEQELKGYWGERREDGSAFAQLAAWLGKNILTKV